MSDSELAAWTSPDSTLVGHISDLTRNSLDAYRADPRLVEEHANLELDIAQGGYGKRQLFELIQNGADAMVGAEGGRIHLLLTDRYLYCANEGAPVDSRGLDALLHAYLSVKRGDEIGRFGLGFKSVLGVTDTPEFFCRAASFGFSAARAENQIRAVVPSAKRCPVLRVAELLDPAKSAEADAYLRALMTWATTVVRLERNVGGSAWLHDDLVTFPPEFLLFCAHVGSLVLEDRARASIREIGVERKEEEFLLVESSKTTVWKVFGTSHEPSDAARRDAGQLAGRDRLPVHWAIPVAERPGPGLLWAFFPLADRTTLSGVINAPWKTNDDRTNLLPGKFNEELLAVVADLVVANLHKVKQESDPAWHLDVMPARGRETRSWADEVLTRLTYERAANAPSLPDQTGLLRRPADLRLHPDVVQREVLDVWSAQSNRPDNWCHASVESRERRSRVERLFEIAGQRAATLADWLSALADRSKPDTFKGCVRVAAALVRANLELRDAVANCWILLDQAGSLARPLSGEVFLPPADGRALSSHIPLLHPELAQDESLRESLETLGVVPVTAELELQAVLKTGIYGWRDTDWDRFWELVRLIGGRAPEIIKAELPNHRTRLKVRTLTGGYKPIHCTLVPGVIVPSDGARDGGLAVDKDHHRGELEALFALGAVAAPAPELGVPEGDFFRRYREECVRSYCERLEADSSQPQPEKLVFSHAAFAGPIEPLPLLSEEGRHLFTETLLKVEGNLSDWVMQHETRQQYPKQRFSNPVLRAIREHGLLGTSLGPRPVHQCVSAALEQLGGILPVATCPAEVAERLGLPTGAAKLSMLHWEAGFTQAEIVDDDELLGRFYGLAAASGTPPPRSLRCRVGHEHRLELCGGITVVTTVREFEALLRDRKPVVSVKAPEDAALLIEGWGLRPAEKSVRTELMFAASGQATPVLDRFPALRLRASAERIESLSSVELLPCSELSVETLTDAGKTVEAVRLHPKGTTVCWLDTLSEPELLDSLNGFLGLGLTAEDRDIVLRERAEQRHRERIVAIRKLQGPAEKLLAAVGPDAIRRHIPTGLIQAVEARRGALSDIDIAKLATVVYGIDVLREFKPDLETAGFQPPDRWAGSSRALSFVRQLGFGQEYAGAEEERRPEVMKVDGPTVLPQLHEFQAKITENIKGLLGDGTPRRGLVALPTGAGKTRVVVQALVEEIKDARLDGPILWIAQSDELCEQTVQAWAEVWHALGPRRRLYLCRLWSQNEAELMDDAPQVVVATIQKLQGCVDSPDYEWLSQASSVVIDEAHLATEPSYTRVLEWQGIGRPKGARCPLIGLTATPFRGHSEEETNRLVGRFGGTRFDTGLGDDPYARLQDLDVLAKVKHQLLGGVDVKLSQEELAEMKKFQRLPASVSAQIAANVDRNMQLVEDISAKPRTWPIIVFATSVEHAQTLAALLAMEGLAAAPITATTDPGTRRHYIDDFRANRIQVLTNYNVLTQGFDAPAVRAIYVARPTFSPTMYQQMIGRGLRGPLNGGKEECLIVNIADNFAKFGTELAFREFEYLWKPPA